MRCAAALLYCAGGGIGDSLVATVVAQALRQRFARVDALTLPGHRAALERCPDLDNVLVDDGGDERALAAQLRERGYEACAITWATARVARVAERAKIPIRVGQARRLYSWRFTDRVVVRSEDGDVTSPWSDILLDYARALHCDAPGAMPRFVPTPEDEREADALLAALGLSSARSTSLRGAARHSRSAHDDTAEDSTSVLARAAEDSPSVFQSAAEDSPSVLARAAEDSPSVLESAAEDSPSVLARAAEDSPSVLESAAEDSPSVLARAAQPVIVSGAPAGREVEREPRNDALPFIILHPTNAEATKRAIWPTQAWSALACALHAELGLPVLISGTDADRAIVEDIVRGCGAAGVTGIAGRLGIGPFGALAKRARAFVGITTGTMHVAAAVGCPTVGIFPFQSDFPDRWAPRGVRTAVVRSTYACHRGDTKENCPDYACIANLNVPRILAETQALLGETTPGY